MYGCPPNPDPLVGDPASGSLISAFQQLLDQQDLEQVFGEFIVPSGPPAFKANAFTTRQSGSDDGVSVNRGLSGETLC